MKRRKSETKKFQAYVKRHINLINKQIDLQQTLIELNDKVDSSDPAMLKPTLESITLAQKELDTVDAALKVVSYKIPDDNNNFALVIDGVNVVGDAETAEWFVMTLNSNK